LNYSDKNNKPVKKNIMTKAKEAVRQFRSANMSKIKMSDDDNGIYSDMLGSYTGMYYDGSEPDQDADDL